MPLSKGSNRLWLLSGLLLLVTSDALAYRGTFEARQIDRRLIPRLNRRDATVSAGNETVGNIGNSQYVSNITIGGVTFNVILDTGSSDLWVTGSVPNATSLNADGSIAYAIGNAGGPILSAQVDFSDFTVQKQAFMQVNDTTSFGALASIGVTGLAGLGPGFSSVIKNKVGSAGDTLLDNIFQACICAHCPLNRTTSNFVTFLLNRRLKSDNGTTHGEFTISEVLPGYDEVLSEPKLPVNELKGSDKLNQHWTTVLDAITGPDGKNISLGSIVDGTPKGKLVTILDSGFTLPQVPRKVSDAIYGRVNGANYSVDDGLWLIPCGQELNISIVFGGVKFFIHPLDTSSSEFGYKFSDGTEACAGAFQPISTAFSLGGQYDAVMGQSFLRNAYTLLNWGDFVDETSAARGTPYVQMEPMTGQAQAHKEFVADRLGGVDTTGDSKWKLSNTQKSSPVSKGERVQHIVGFAERNKIIIGVCAGIGLLIIVALICLCCCRRRRSRKAGAGRSMLPANRIDLNRLSGEGRYRSMKDPRSVPHTHSAGSNKHDDPFSDMTPVRH
ncbi:aspartic peptidase domain-containing protein [Cantharellus anzutake]|uniref:aspartic peptidase domain-containing protein n=1 Tax=Cantharellus anzutake TaxID=1750568 RepID=UPI001907BC36|nr:aspartic peptidase domain-containing protein [Cantharellus anzutake]KAF8342240.1 aspartic peptidase domain-containing protein [Cantharellus anzutake]